MRISMKLLILTLLVTFQASAQEAASPEVSGEESLQKSFQREYVYMSSQKQALKNQKTQLEKNFQQRISGLKGQTQSLQKELVSLTSQNDEQHELLMSLEKRKKDLQKKGSSLENTFKKARNSSLEFAKSLHFEAPEKSEVVVPEALSFDDFEKLMGESAQLLEASAQTESFPGSFLNQQGDLVEGTITRIGRSAAIGSVKGQHFVLGPNGEGLLKALEVAAAPTSRSLNLYLFESLHRAAKIQRQGGWVEKLADLSPLLFLGLILFLVAGLFGALIKV